MKIIELDWLDAHRKDGWYDDDHIKNKWNEDDGMTHLVGYFVHETKDWLYVAGGYDLEANGEHSWLCTHKIPKKMIARRRMVR